MMVKIQRYLKDFFRNRDSDVIIGTMDGKIAKRFLKDCIGIGFDTLGACAHIGEYDLIELDGKWAVDIKGTINKSYQQSSLVKVEDGLKNPDFFHYWASLVLIDSTVLEEVSHTVGYKHITEKEKTCAHEFFVNLVIRYLEQPDKGSPPEFL